GAGEGARPGRGAGQGGGSVPRPAAARVRSARNRGVGARRARRRAAPSLLARRRPALSADVAPVRGWRMADLAALLEEAVGAGQVLVGEKIAEDYSHDEALGSEPVVPAAVVLPRNADDVAAVLRVASEHNVSVTARGSGTGLSGAARPREGGIVVSFERMNKVLE